MLDPHLHTPPDRQRLVGFEPLRRGDIGSWGRDRNGAGEGEGEAEDVGAGVDEGGGGVFPEIDVLDLGVLPFQVDNPT